ncbi:MAG TPA: nucleotidyl transferase AbiEii/AbiGii toxin family protein [Chloroflexota bacterium]|nr:nucleotidyl transferase AbiEii/AbiGii toxin family protein [Chloroflexota bacterium]
MNGTREYGSPAAFRQALTAKLKAKAQEGPWNLAQLQRQMAYDRLLERLYLRNDDWIVKGATALLARDIGVRATIDIDVYREVAREVAEADLRVAAAKDIGDWFSFEIALARPVADGAVGTRLPVTAYVGTTVWASFHVDLVGPDVRMTGQPEPVPPLARVEMPDVSQHGYRAYPLVDHIADKVIAMFELHGARRMPSTRYKDLVDLVAIAIGASVEAEAQLKAIAAQAGRRGIVLPEHFDVPDRALWEPGYAAEAGRSLLRLARTLDDALAIVGPFLDPLLDGNAAGRWDAERRRWTS